MTTFKYNTVNTANTNSKNFDITIDINKYFKTNTKTYNNIDYTSTIINKIKSIFPWAKTNNNTIIFDSMPIENYTFTSITPEALNIEWNKAASRLYDYIYYTNNPSYDFKINNIPVKIHGNYIQIGHRLIPKFTESSFFTKIPKKERIILYNISLNINSIEIAA